MPRGVAVKGAEKYAEDRVVPIPVPIRRQWERINTMANVASMSDPEVDRWAGE